MVVAILDGKLIFKNNFQRELPKINPNKIRFKLTKCFQRRKLKSEKQIFWSLLLKMCVACSPLRYILKRIEKGTELGWARRCIVNSMCKVVAILDGKLIIKNNFQREPTKINQNQVRFKLAQWFQRRKLNSEKQIFRSLL